MAQHKGAERRVAHVADLEVRGDATKPTITGHAAVFDQLSADLGGFRERIAPGTFRRAIRDGHDVRALFHHNPDRVLGRSASRTLKLAEDSVGLAVEIQPPKSEAALLELMRRGDVSQMSFGFIARGEEWEERDEYDLWTVTDVDLFDVCLVTYPAYPQTDAAVRSLERWKAFRTDPVVMKLNAMKLRLEREYAAAHRLNW